jgi:hypothetical protein
MAERMPGLFDMDERLAELSAKGLEVEANVQAHSAVE